MKTWSPDVSLKTAFTVTLALAMAILTAAGQPRYSIHEIPIPPLATEMAGYKINNHNKVVGHFTDGRGLWQPFLYSRGTLSNLGLVNGAAFTINDRDLIIGSAEGFSWFLYDRGSVTDVSAAFGRQPISVAEVNNHGVIVGTVSLSNLTHSAFVYHEGRFRLLEGLPSGGYTYTDGFAINDRGYVAGQSSLLLPDGNLVARAVIWDAAGLHDLGTLPDATHSVCVGINDRGDATGHADLHGFIYSDGTMRSIGNLPGYFYNFPRDINDRGDIVGESNIESPGENRAFLYSDGAIYDLNALIPANSGWFLVLADGINNHGYITGRAIFENRFRAFILEPVRSQTGR
jgi:probable HAF family extracellular repeat protein